MTLHSLSRAFLCAAWILTGILSGPALADTEGNWSKDATPLETEATRVVAPGGKNAIGHVASGLIIEAGGTQIPLTGVPGSPPLVDVMWSPDGRKFAITGTNGGLVGPWQTTIYEIDTQGAVLLRDLSGALAQEARDFAKCDKSENVNVGAVTWRSPIELLIAVEVPPHSSCTNKGEKLGLRIDLRTMGVAQRLSDAELKTAAKGKLLR